MAVSSVLRKILPRRVYVILFLLRQQAISPLNHFYFANRKHRVHCIIPPVLNPTVTAVTLYSSGMSRTKTRYFPHRILLVISFLDPARNPRLSKPYFLRWAGNFSGSLVWRWKIISVFHELPLRFVLMSLIIWPDSHKHIQYKILF